MSGSISEWAAQQAAGAFSAQDITPKDYAAMRYPKWLPLMRFSCRQYALAGFGNLFTMDTLAMGGLMRLATLVFTPSAGASVPFLLIDTMQMKKKTLAYVEYYDCTAQGADLPHAAGQQAEFAALPDYAEKSAWYVARRTPYSLIKGGDGADAQALEAMVKTCLERYLQGAQTAAADPANLAGLADFQRDMLDKGNPSAPTLNKVLGEAGARKMFETAIMPVVPFENP